MISQTIIVVQVEGPGQYRVRLDRAGTARPVMNFEDLLSARQVADVLLGERDSKPRAAIYWRDPKGRNVETPAEMTDLMRELGAPLSDQAVCPKCRQRGVVLGTTCPSCGAPV